MRVYFIRHGQSVNNARPTPDVPRVQDPGLTNIGRRQAQLLAVHLATKSDPVPVSIEATDAARQLGNYGISKLYTSPMWRTLQTAQAVSETLGLLPEVWIDMHEQGGVYEQHGEKFVGFPGKTRSEILTTFPNFVLPEAIGEDGWWNRDHETWDEADDRAERILTRLRPMAEKSNATIAIITHQFFLNILLKSLFGMRLHRDVYFNHYNTGIARLDIEPNGVTFVRYLNRVDHLPSDLMTT